MRLKIKDNVDLKELEKYGFKKEELIGDIPVSDWYTGNWVNEKREPCEPPYLDRKDIDSVYYYTDSSMINIYDKDGTENKLPRELYYDEFDIKLFYKLMKDGLIEEIKEDGTKENVQ